MRIRFGEEVTNQRESSWSPLTIQKAHFALSASKSGQDPRRGDRGSQRTNATSQQMLPHLCLMGSRVGWEGGTGTRGSGGASLTLEATHLSVGHLHFLTVDVSCPKDTLGAWGVLPTSSDPKDDPATPIIHGCFAFCHPRASTQHPRPVTHSPSLLPAHQHQSLSLFSVISVKVAIKL